MANVGVIPYADKGDVGNKKPEDLTKCKLVFAGDLVINSMNYGIGSYGLSSYTGICSPVYIVLTPKLERVEERFAFRILENKAFQGFAQSHGNGILEHRAAINWDILKRIGVPLPPVPEQLAILQLLDRETAKIDALVAEQEKLIALLQEKRQAVISHAVTKGLDPNVPMKDSGVEWLGEVPGHWECIRLKQLVIESVAGPYGASLTKAMYSTDGYRVYGQQQVIADDFSVGDYFISEEKYEEMRRYTVCEGDVLVSVMGTVGKVAVVPADAPPGIINPRLVRYRCGDLIQPRYLQSVLMCQTHQRHLALESNGTTMDGLNMVTLGRVPIPTPPVDEQAKILQYLKEQAQKFDPLINEAHTAITLLQERRTALISAAVTGQIDVRGIASREVA
jgi:type I restriction enzyme S subunit